MLCICYLLLEENLIGSEMNFCKGVFLFISSVKNQLKVAEIILSACIDFIMPGSYPVAKLGARGPWTKYQSGLLAFGVPWFLCAQSHHDLPGKRQALLTVVRGECREEDINPIYPRLPSLDC